jgi:hypothetical protein
MFNERESNTAVLENLEASSRVAARFMRKREEPVKREGLCCNCEVRETCIYPNTKRAVWFCEEYQ